MDKIIHYRTLIKNILIQYDQLANNPPIPEVETILAFDDEHNQYIWFQVGWNQKERVKGITIHIQIKNNKIWIEEDWTEVGIANDLVDSGVPQSDIVLGFHPPEVRSDTDFAVA